MKDTILIAVADDQVLFRESLVQTIGLFNNMEVMIEADNGQQLLQKIDAGERKPGIVLLDLNMPLMNGIEATKKLHALYPDIKIIVLSVHGDEKHVARMVQLGINGFVAKNAGLAELRRAIEAAYYNGFYFNEAVVKVLQGGMPVLTTRPAAGNNALLQLTRREKEILTLICRELNTSEIASRLYVSKRTVEGHRNHLLEKTGARNIAGLVLFALKHKLVDVDF